MLQLALLPSITGFGSAQALLADSGSRNVTCTINIYHIISYNNNNDDYDKDQMK